MSDQSSNERPAFLDPNLPITERVNDLVGRMTVTEKIAQMMNSAPGIERLGVRPYQWQSEALHGVARGGIATVFPQAIGLAAAWDVDLHLRVATAIGDEARAKHHEAERHGEYDRIYLGLTYWSPNINIFRDPRWGRGQETYGEDPYLTARLGVAFVRGLQGDHPRYLKNVATPKHYAVHSGPEAGRHSFDVSVSAQDLWGTYLPAFEACIREAHAASMMTAYNRYEGVPCCAHPRLLGDILRKQWGFDGYVVSDCGAIRDIWEGHKVAADAAGASVMAVRGGCDLECWGEFVSLREAVQDGKITEAELDTAVKRLFTARMRLGMFDPSEMVPYAHIPYGVNDCSEHRALALQAARESLVLLKNEGGLLPLAKSLRRVAVIGPNADDVNALLGNYNGTPSAATTPLAGLRALVGEDTEIVYAPGCAIGGQDRSGITAAAKAARDAFAAIVFLGLSQALEGEEGGFEGIAEGQTSQGDRITLDLPPLQEDLLRAIVETGTPVVLVLLNGSAVAVRWAKQHVPAILEAWYPGEEGGRAIAEALFGDYNPGGRLPVTFYESVGDLPPFTDYAMAGRTYRYFSGRPLYPFGHGLSYTWFAYNGLEVTPQQAAAGAEVTVRVTVQNVGKRAGDEVVQLYLRDVQASWPTPRLGLQGFKRLHLQPGERQTVSFTLKQEQMVVIDDWGRKIVEPGDFEVSVGGGQPGFAQVLQAKCTGGA
jgi:beta-glucosidase